MSAFVAIAPIEVFAAMLCQQDEHVIAWRAAMWRRGIDVRKNGRRYDLRGNALEGPSRMGIAMQDDTRYCPTCDSTDLVIEGETIACKDCGRLLSGEDGDDPEWVASGKRS
jgi:RNA polymerase subunit RPABC4/transcription elongation factor Spt4